MRNMFHIDRHEKKGNVKCWFGWLFRHEKVCLDVSTTLQKQLLLIDVRKIIDNNLYNCLYQAKTTTEMTVPAC